ncbi:MAG TPA: alpha/beta hydrolase [Thermoleophilaceae bacterium]|nr:alpha/beta hydrolase [Thermoleophilaceae bacterium]
MPEPSRARYPDDEGYAQRDGVRLFYEVYGNGEPTLFLLPHGVFAHSRAWKAQIPYLARHMRVVAYDERGSGRSDRPRGTAAFDVPELVHDAIAVMDATSTDRAVIVSAASACRSGLALAAGHPDRVAGCAFIGPYLPMTPWPPTNTMWKTYEEPRAWRRALRILRYTAGGIHVLVRSPDLRHTYARFARRVGFLEGVRKFNRHYVLRDQHGFVDWAARTLNFTEPHSTRAIEDEVAWGMETDAETTDDAWTALDFVDSLGLKDAARLRELCAGLRCPVLVLHGELDIAIPPAWGAAVAEASGGRFVTVTGAGHSPQGRKPVPVNLALREFAQACRAAEPMQRSHA